MNEQPFYIYRYSEPTQQDSAEQYTICKVDCGSDGFDVYYQLNKNEDSPTWIFVGRFSSITSNQIVQEQIQIKFGDEKK